ncbi:MAG: glycosyltransferase family 4 protein [Verrucomicrobiota bacterium]
MSVVSDITGVAHVMRRFTKEKWGGTETVVFNLAKYLETSSIRSPIHCTAMLSKPGKETVDGVALHRHWYTFPWLGLNADDIRRLELKGGSPLSPGLLSSLLSEAGINLIHTHVQLRLGGMAKTAALLKRIPYVVSIHGGVLTTPKAQVDQMKAPFEGKFEWGKVAGALLGSRQVLTKAHAVVCVGADEQRLMQKKFPEQRVEYIPNGVHVDQFQNRSDQEFRAFVQSKIPATAPYVLCISRIDYQKNQKLLVEAFAEFHKAHPDYFLVLIGPVTVEAYKKEIEDLARELGIEDRLVLIPGFPPGDPLLASALSGANMFVLPTDHEPFGIVILEAWAAGTPVIATSVGGIPEFTSDQSNILLTPKGDLAALCERMNTLAAQPELRKRLIQEAQVEVIHYDWANIGKRYLALYQDVIVNSKKFRN